MTAGLLAVLAGVGFGKQAPVLPFWPLIFLVIAVIFCAKKKNVVLLGVVILCGFSIGWWRGGQFGGQLEPYRDLALKKVVLEVRAEQDAVYADKGQLEFDAGSVHMVQPNDVYMPGRVKVSGYGELAVRRGDAVQVQGRLYPTRGSRQASVSFAQLDVLQHNGSWIEDVRRAFVAGMTTALPEPHASFALGLLLGQRSTLPENVSQQLATVGLTHIIAVSGYNLTIIIQMVRRASEKRSKFQATVLSVVLVVGFLLMTGFSASIVRAAIVSMLSLAAWYYGRAFRPLLLLSIAAAGTALASPLYVWSDVGWYLSFLAFYGVLILAPLIAKRVSVKQPKLLASVLLETAAAQLMTLPLILCIFGQTSILALLSNMAVVPLVPIAMVLSLAAGVAGMAAPAVAAWVALPAQIVLTYMLDSAGWLSRLPHATLTQALPVAGLIVLYASLAVVSLVLWRKTEVERDILLADNDDM